MVLNLNSPLNIRGVCCALRDSAVWRVVMMKIEFYINRSSYRKMSSRDLNPARRYWNSVFSSEQLKFKYQSVCIDNPFITKCNNVNRTNSMDYFHVSIQAIFPNKWFTAYCACIFCWHLLCIMHSQVGPQSNCCYTIFVANTASMRISRAKGMNIIIFSNWLAIQLRKQNQTTYTKISGLWRNENWI